MESDSLNNEKIINSKTKRKSEGCIDRSEEANQILEAIKADCFNMRDHAGRRSDEHQLSRRNVVNVARTIISWKYQDDKCTHRFIGFLDKEQPGGFTAVINDGVWVVTVFKRRLSRNEKNKNVE